MSTGYRSKSALGVARIALLAGASAAALFAAGSANAQNADGVQQPPAFSVTPPQTYAIDHGGVAPGSPSGADLSVISIPGVAVSTAPMVLEACLGAGGGCVATDGPVVKTTPMSQVLNGNGTPVNQTYASEITGVGPFAFYHTNNPFAAPIHVIEGLGSNGGSILVNAATGVPADYGVGFIQDPFGAANAGYKWVAAASVDNSSTATPATKWVSATYGNDAHITATATHLVSANPAGTTNWYLTDGHGNPVNIFALGLNPIQLGVLQTAIDNHDIAAYNAALTSFGKTSVAVAASATDPALTASATLYTYQGAVTSAQGTGNGTVTTNVGGSASTTSLAGGVVYANNAGQYLAAGAGGLTNADAAGNKTSLTPTGLTVVDTHGNSSNLTAGNLLLTSTGVGYVSISSSADPVITVSNGTPSGTTTINNGTVSAGTWVSTPTLYATTANVGTTNTGNLHVAPGGTVDMGGNRVQDVGAPVAGTDATNKAYVDKGVNKAYEGTALALAISQPVFLPGQSFAVRAGWGDYEGQNAFGVSAAGVIAHNTFGYGSTVSLDGGVGVGGNYGGVAGKAGVTVGFGGGSAPLK